MGAEYWELPRDLLRRGRRPKGVRRLEAFFWATAPPREVKEIERRLEDGETIPSIAAALGWSERKVQGLLARTRNPQLPWEQVQSVDGRARVCQEGEASTPVTIFELACSSCGLTVYHTAAVPADSPQLRGEWLFHCPYCKRRQRERPQAQRPLRYDEVMEWRKTRSHERRQQLFHRG
jgi:hypothetical protein